MAKAESSTRISGVFVVQWFEFPTGNRAYGGGGWSRNARHRPAPERLQKIVKELEFKGKSVIVDGQRKLRLNIYDAKSKKWIRSDYPELQEDLKFHGELHQLIVKAKSNATMPAGSNRAFQLE